jgi:replicative DNA helicase
MSSGIDRYLDPSHTVHADPMSRVYYEAQSEMIAPVPATHFKLFPNLDRMTGGLRPKEFTILCGATGTGKTTLCANLSRDLLLSQVPQFVASVETGHTDYVRRMISAIAGYDWNTGDPVPMDMLRVFNDQNLEHFKSDTAWLSLYDNRTTVEALMADIAYMVRMNGTKVVLIDNLNFFLEVTSAANAVVEMDRVIHELIIFCKQVPVHVIMVMHPKKTEHGRVESEFDIKGSSTAVQEAHNVLLWNRVHPDLVKAGVATEGDRELMIAKMRRKGKFVRRRLIFRAKNAVQYHEGDIV